MEIQTVDVRILLQGRHSLKLNDLQTQITKNTQRKTSLLTPFVWFYCSGIFMTKSFGAGLRRTINLSKRINCSQSAGEGGGCDFIKSAEDVSCTNFTRSEYRCIYLSVGHRCLSVVTVTSSTDVVFVGHLSSFGRTRKICLTHTRFSYQWHFRLLAYYSQLLL